MGNRGIGRYGVGYGPPSFRRWHRSFHSSGPVVVYFPALWISLENERAGVSCRRLPPGSGPDSSAPSSASRRKPAARQTGRYGPAVHLAQCPDGALGTLQSGVTASHAQNALGCTSARQKPRQTERGYQASHRHSGIPRLEPQFEIRIGFISTNETEKFFTARVPALMKAVNVLA